MSDAAPQQDVDLAQIAQQVQAELDGLQRKMNATPAPAETLTPTPSDTDPDLKYEDMQTGEPQEKENT
jgi:hypothetical protein